MEEKRIATIYDERRMCDFYKTSNHKHERNCTMCPFSSAQNKDKSFCDVYKDNHLDEANEIILKWRDEHPQKTYKDDFLEKFPNAAVAGDNNAGTCRKFIYGQENCRGYCTECWNEIFSE